MGKPRKYGDWKRLDSLGEGGQARTYHVRHQDGREAVLKCIKNPKRGWRANREIEALKRLKSPAVPTILDFGESEGHPWFVTENCGKSLPKVINQATLVHRVSWFRDIVLATRDAHQAGITHRDIKPDNVVISIDESAAYLIDFGICAISDSGPSLTTLEAFGNAAYAAPECALGYSGQPGKSSDIYSLGKVLYWLTGDGKPIFREETRELEGTLLLTSSGVEEMRILSIIRACVKESPEDRPTAEELLIRAQNLLAYVEQIIQEENQGLYRIIDNFGNNNEFSPAGIYVFSPRFTIEDFKQPIFFAGSLNSRIQAERPENRTTRTLRIYRISLSVRCLSPEGQIYVSLVEDSEGTPSGRELGVYSLDLTHGPAKISSIECDIKIAPGQFWILLKPANLPKTCACIHGATDDVALCRSISAESDNGGKTWEIRESRGAGIAVRIDASAS